MTEYEAALKLLDLLLVAEPGAAQDKAKILALFQECLAAVRGQAQ